jgi:CRISPR-associated protein Csm3
MDNVKLIGKIIITGKLKAMTGLHIGGSKTALDIGGVDLNVIKTPQGVPFIPGSSLKGKLRSLLGRTYGCRDVEKDEPFIKELFGTSGAETKNDKTKSEKMTVTRLLVRDAFACLQKGQYEGDLAGTDLELDYTEIKWENTIDRLKGTAEHPRQLERVPAGALFRFELVYDVYDDVLDKNGNLDTSKHLFHLKIAMQILQHDYLGGQGSRGYGKVRFDDIALAYHKITGGEYKDMGVTDDLKNFHKSLQEL